MRVEVQENWKLWLLRNGNYPIHRLRTFATRSKDDGSRKTWSLWKSRNAYLNPNLNHSHRHHHYHHHLCQSCTKRARASRKAEDDYSRIEINLELGQRLNVQASLGNERKIDESLSVRPVLANFMFTESWIPFCDVSYIAHRAVRLLPLRKVTKLKKGCTSSLDPSYRTIIRPRSERIWISLDEWVYIG